MRITFVFLLTLYGFAQAQSIGFYSAVEGKAGLELRNALNGMLKAGAMVVPYSAPAGTTDTGAAMRVIDEAPNDTTAVRLVYSGLNAPKADLNNTTGWDRAHLWPNSYGIDSVGPAYSDLHNLRPCDSTVNGSRSNLLYDDSDPGDGFAAPAHPEAPGTSRDFNSWEMPDSQKGDIARAMFYMDVRYEGTNGEPNLQLTDDLATVTATNSNMGRFSSFLVWHILDPVSPEERLRNDRVFAFQGNRNPFVDRPEWVLAVYGNPFELKMRLLQHESGGIISHYLILTPVTFSRRLFYEYGADLGDWKNDSITTMGPSDSQGGLLDTVYASKPKRFFRLVVK